MHFARVLRAAGLPVGPGRALEGVRAVIAAGVGSRQDFYWTLFAVFVNRQDHRDLFDQAFHVFWRNPRILERMLHALMPQLQVEMDESRNEAISRRVAEALAKGEGAEQPQEEAEEEIEFDAALTYSAREVLQEMDFESMSAEEVAQARAIIARMRLPIMAVPTRRLSPDVHGRRVDMRASLRAALRSGGGVPLRHRSRKHRHPPLVVLCDISGSMSRYSRMFLHFMHAITNDRDRVHTFVFGTRLTNITRHLRHRDVDIALEKVSGGVEDWSGGTRIGHSLHDFNTNWSRRVLGQGAVVLMISDGLDRDAGEGIGDEIERLHKSCRRLIWLNPLLRYDGFEPKSKGIKALLPHVDDFRTVHNLASLGDLAEALSRPQTNRAQSKKEAA
ncbi:MAG: VWA domain-containing protein [Rhodospirillaceae bacterium]|nr:VWA domain-containing protein [Rhodospirillaceae bacterium]MBT5191045.1 VWA domain-containing protein [Rhodospirillaceae bacterium]MBT5895569.1 VWA domain-containing protein [Rhodospirillaceae bacterium]MBT6428131.1 VWA domain-containing protein [Rhodospirillaceae bacterium]